MDEEAFLDRQLSCYADDQQRPRNYEPEVTSRDLADQKLATDLRLIRDMKHRYVHLYLDQDQSGQGTTNEVRVALAGMRIVDHSNIYAGYKDFNDFLVGRSKCRPWFFFSSHS